MHYFEKKLEKFNKYMLDEFTRNEPSIIKVMKLAVGVHFNSPKLTMDGDIQSSHIGYYFSTIHFKDWVTKFEPKVGRPVQYALFYSGNVHSDLVHGSATVRDTRTYTIVYGIDNADFAKEVIKEEPSIQSFLETGVPNLEKMAKPLHEIAEECVRYAMVYFENDDTDALIVPQTKLYMFGDILKASEYGPGIKVRRATGGPKEETNRGTDVKSLGYFYTVPADKVKDYAMFKYNVNNRGGIEYQTIVDKKPAMKKIGMGAGTDTYEIKLPDGSIRAGIKGFNGFDELYVKALKNKGLIAGYDEIPVKRTGVRGVLEKGDDIKKKKPTAKITKASGSQTTGDISVTLAFSADSFARGSKMANTYVMIYNDSHKKSKATIDINSQNQSVEINDIDQSTFEKMKSKFENKGIEFEIL